MIAAAGAQRLPVTLAEVRDDWLWFARARRRYRVRRTADGGGWIIRRRAGVVFLRCWASSLPSALPDNDEALRAYWFRAAWPDLPAAQRAELIKEARKLEHS